MLHAPLRAADNFSIVAPTRTRLRSVFSERKPMKRLEKRGFFYRRYITAAAHWKHWPTFLHTVTCSTVAEREEAGGGVEGMGEEDSVLPMQHGGRSWEREEAGALTLRLSGCHKCLRNSLFTQISCMEKYL